MASGRKRGSMSGTLLAAPRNPSVKLYPKGRVCSEKGCKTVLSVYNKKDECSRHEKGELPRANARY